MEAPDSDEINVSSYLPRRRFERSSRRHSIFGLLLEVIGICLCGVKSGHGGFFLNLGADINPSMCSSS
ncbi:hypothetical protein BDR06DRAFT_958289 [Suillus hirtellus]|nr:hypothetical protein BDR06DRAFT_958289 [Suillus hirtellus]